MARACAGVEGGLWIDGPVGPGAAVDAGDEWFRRSGAWVAIQRGEADEIADGGAGDVKRIDVGGESGDRDGGVQCAWPDGERRNRCLDKE